MIPLTKFHASDPIQDIRVPITLNEALNFMDLMADYIQHSQPMGPALTRWAEQYKFRRSKA